MATIRGIKQVLKEQIDLVKPDREHLLKLKRATKEFIETLKEELEKEEAKSEVFVGGSFAKNTLVKKEKYDVDIFVRFDWRYDDISGILGRVLKKVCNKRNLRMKKLHGSRDYFVVKKGDEKYYFEIIPVVKIKKVHEERNVTDLSYFHVSYVRNKLRGKENEVLLAKTFFHAQKIYGAETYIQGFHGYALECLIIKYKSFINMLKALSKVDIKDRLVIDLEKYYKKKRDVFLEMNENRLKSPIILIDPVYKERNALASLSHETFSRFQKAAKKFIKNPSKKFFVDEEIDEEKIKNKAKKGKAEFLKIGLETDKQEGDIAGTKMKKFSDMLIDELGTYYKIFDKEFEYDDKKSAKNYIILKSKKEIIRIGPPIKMKKHVVAFKREHKKTFEKNGYVHTKIKIDFSAKKFVNDYKKKYKKKIKEMGITNLRIF